MSSSPPPKPLRLVEDGGPFDAEHRARFARSGDRASFEALATPHLDTLYTVCLRMVGSHAVAEEIAQDALIKALTRHRRYDPKRRFRPWLMTIAANLCRDRLRSAWWRKVLRVDRDGPTDEPAPDREVARLRRDRQIREAMQHLSPDHREALSLFHLEDMSYKEMSAITGVSVSALKQRVKRGSASLREIMREMYPALTLDRTGDEGPE